MLGWVKNLGHNQFLKQDRWLSGWLAGWILMKIMHIWPQSQSFPTWMSVAIVDEGMKELNTWLKRQAVSAK